MILIYTVIVVIGYFYFFFKDAQVIFNEFVHTTQSYCENLAQTITREGGYSITSSIFVFCAKVFKSRTINSYNAKAEAKAKAEQGRRLKD